MAAALLSGPAAAREIVQGSHAELIRGLIPSVVNIAARIGVPDVPAKTLDKVPDKAVVSAGQSALPYKISVSNGSGFVIDPSGLIATNWHVVTDAFEIMVTFADGTRLPAKVVGAWRVVDLALLQVDAGHPLPAVHWGDSSAVQIGDPVLAMGNAFGVGLSVSAGIVSALNRNIGDSLVDDFIQTDAAINHGNSGGPLFNLNGEVIGVNSAMLSPTAANAGLGFAIPSNDAQFVLHRMVNIPDAERPAWLGAKIQAMTPEMAEALGQLRPLGPIIAWVLPDEPAQKAGMLAGDVVLRFDGQTIADERALLRAVTTRRPGEEVTFGIWRDGREMELKVTLEPWPKTVWELNIAPPSPSVHLTVPPDLGLTVVPLTDALRTANGIAPNVRGVLVTGVEPDSDAARQGVAIGDMVLQVGSTRVRTPEELRHQIDRARGGGRRFGLFMVLSKTPPVAVAQFPGPNWVALRLAAD
ncbi:MAG: serine protease Do [Acetobacteraceae bacterium]|nr:serine protease Do [Acetobacteraceae bacterium]